ncbi:MAG: SEL1-like repeat protein [Parachlamydiaceae bacterium]|nr:SEL1-like repeat protein [Parachlamydiaceae bacterium]
MLEINAVFTTQQAFDERFGKVLHNLAHGESLLIKDGKITTVSNAVEGLSDQEINKVRNVFVTVLERNSEYLDQYGKYLKSIGDSWGIALSSIPSSDERLVKCVVRKALPVGMALAARRHEASMDVGFVTADKLKIRAHSVVFKQSQFLSALIEDNLDERDTLPLTHGTKQEMEEVLDFLYTGHIQEVSLETLLNLSRLALVYGLPSLTQYCKEGLDRILLSLPPLIIPAMLVYARKGMISPEIRPVLLNRFNTYGLWGYLGKLTAQESKLLYEFCLGKSTSEELTATAICHLRGIGTDKNPQRALELFQDAIKESNRVFLKKYPDEASRPKEAENYRPAVQLGVQLVDRQEEYGLNIPTGIAGQIAFMSKPFWRDSQLDDQGYMKLLMESVDVPALTGFADQVKETEPECAVGCYKRAAFLGDSDALYRLGHCYRNGKGVKQDLTQAFELYRLASNQGNVKAMYYLMKCYQEGRGTEINVVQAKLWANQIMHIGVDALIVTWRDLLDNAIESVKNNAIEIVKQCASAEDKAESKENATIAFLSYPTLLQPRQYSQELLLELRECLEKEFANMPNQQVLPLLRLDQATMDCEVISQEGDSVPVHGFMEDFVESKVLHASFGKKGAKGAGIELSAQQLHQVFDFLYTGEVTDRSAEQLMALHEAVQALHLPKVAAYCMRQVTQGLKDEPMNCVDLMIAYWGQSKRNQEMEVMLLEKFIETTCWARFKGPKTEKVYKICCLSEEGSEYVMAAACCLANGIGVAMDADKAIEMCHVLAKQGYIPAQYRHLIWMNLKNKTEISPATAASEWNDAVQADYIPVLVSYGQLMIGQDVLDLFEAAASKGYAPAFYQLARYWNAYHSEVVVFNNLLEAAKRGFIGGYLQLAQCYEHGTGCEKNLELAVKYCRLLADEEIALGMIGLARLYQQGLGVTKDLHRAKMLVVQALELDQLSEAHKADAMALKERLTKELMG